MSGVNPKDARSRRFKRPSADELSHDFLWRCEKALPARGRIGIFNRSYYEEVLVTRVHPDVLAAKHLPPTRRQGRNCGTGVTKTSTPSSVIFSATGRTSSSSSSTSPRPSRRSASSSGSTTRTSTGSFRRRPGGAGVLRRLHRTRTRRRSPRRRRRGRPGTSCRPITSTPGERSSGASWPTSSNNSTFTCPSPWRRACGARPSRQALLAE